MFLSANAAASKLLQLTLDEGQLFILKKLIMNPRFPYDNYMLGIVSQRDGSVEKLFTDNDDEDYKFEVIVLVKNIASGGYLSADLYDIDDNQLSLKISIKDIELRKK
jgi:hypothetical protein